MRAKTKLVCGVGINDAGYQVSLDVTINGRRKTIWRCPIYRKWIGMLGRCYLAKAQAKRPTYIGCSVAREWLTFSAFRAWMLAQDHEGMQLDKDILIQGNKVYSPEACVFVPGSLNRFISDSGASRGEWPIGVRWHKDTEKFNAQCQNPFTGKQESLGLFTGPDAAHEAWRARKHQLACQYADQQTDPRIADALRNRYAKKPEGETA